MFEDLDQDTIYSVSYFSNKLPYGDFIDDVLTTIILSFAIVLNKVNIVIDPARKALVKVVTVWLGFSNRPRKYIYKGSRLTLRDLLSARKLILSILPVVIISIVLFSQNLTLVDVLLWISRNPELFTSLFVALLATGYYILSDYHIIDYKNDSVVSVYSSVSDTTQKILWSIYVIGSSVAAVSILLHIFGIIYLSTGDFLGLSWLLVISGFTSAYLSYFRATSFMSVLSTKTGGFTDEYDDSLAHISRTYPFFWNLVIGVSTATLLTSLIMPTILVILTGTNNIGAGVFGAEVGSSVDSAAQGIIDIWTTFNWWHFITAIAVLSNHIWYGLLRFTVSNANKVSSLTDGYKTNISFKQMSTIIMSVLIIINISFGGFFIAQAAGNIELFNSYKEFQADSHMEGDYLILESTQTGDTPVEVTNIKITITQDGSEYTMVSDHYLSGESGDYRHTGYPPEQEWIDSYNLNPSHTQWDKQTEYNNSRKYIKLDTDVINPDEQFTVTVTDQERGKVLHQNQLTMGEFNVELAGYSNYYEGTDLYNTIEPSNGVNKITVNEEYVESTLYMGMQVFTEDGDRASVPVDVSITNSDVAYESDYTTGNKYNGRVIIGQQVTTDENTKTFVVARSPSTTTTVNYEVINNE